MSVRAMLDSPLWTLLDAPVLAMDCVDAMAAMPAASIDAVVCDPPYGLEFMGKEWDRLGDVRQPNDPTFHRSGVGPFDRAKVRHGGYQEKPRWTDDHMGKGFHLPNYFMAGPRMQEWHEAWAREALRVLKPGGHLLAFGGSRTSHRLACAIEDAGFEIRDSIMWLYGSGFPKSLDVSKALDKAAGAEREVVGEYIARGYSEVSPTDDGRNQWAAGEVVDKVAQITAAATPEAERWDGWGTALKPAHEPIIVARKPLAGTVAANVLEHGTGALNIGGCRIGWDEDGDRSAARKAAGYSDAAKKALGGVVASESATGFSGEVTGTDASAGRWPANVVLSHTEDCQMVGTRRVKAIAGTASGRMGPDYQSGVYGGYTRDDGRFGEPTGYGDEDGMETVEAWACVAGCPVAELDAQTGILKSGDGNVRQASGADRNGNTGTAYGAESRPAGTPMVSYGDAGGASRFFYTAKASRAERSAGLDGFDEHRIGALNAGVDGSLPRNRPNLPRANVHPTVKPIDLMRWLVRLATPPGGLVLDPFAGSGTTGCACALEGFEFVGVERDPEYVRIGLARIAFWRAHPTHLPVEAALAAQSTRAAVRGAGQLELL